MSLRQPLLLLLMLPALAWFVYGFFKRKRVRFSPSQRLSALGFSWRSKLWFLPELFLLAFFLVFAVLVAGPQTDLGPESSQEDGLSIVIVLDRSGSMGAMVPYENQEISRLEGVKEVTRDFLKSRKQDQIALLSFARYPETHAPLTSKHQIIADFLTFISLPSTESEDGTAIGDALVLAAARVSRNSPQKGRVVILLTDGQHNAGDKTPNEAATLVAGQKATLYTIGLGGSGFVVQNTPQGPQQIGMPVVLDEKQLTAIAEATGGRYFRADNIAALAGLYNAIAGQETAKLNQDQERQSELNLNWGIWLLVLFLLVQMFSRYYVLKRGEL